MTQEQKELLLKLLKQAHEDELLNFYDDEENSYYADWMFIDNGQIYIKIEEP